MEDLTHLRSWVYERDKHDAGWAADDGVSRSYTIDHACFIQTSPPTPRSVRCVTSRLGYLSFTCVSATQSGVSGQAPSDGRYIAAHYLQNDAININKWNEDLGTGWGGGESNGTGGGGGNGYGPEAADPWLSLQECTDDLYTCFFYRT